MKKEGIYTTISPYWAASLKHVPASWGIEGWPENQDPQGLLFFNPQLQEGYKAWLKALLTPPNPVHGHSPGPGPRAGDHPAPERRQHALLDHAEREGPATPAPGGTLRQVGWRRSTARSTVRFRPGTATRCRRTTPSRGMLGIHIVWEWTQPRQGGRKRRLDDQLAVLRGDDVPLQPGDGPLPSRRSGLQAARQRRQLEDRRHDPAQRRRAVELHGQRGARGQQLLQPGSHRARPGLADRQGGLFPGHLGAPQTRVPFR